jgi:hypothetical protein
VPPLAGSACEKNTGLDGNERSDYRTRPCPVKRSDEPGGSGGGSENGKTVIPRGDADEPPGFVRLLAEHVRASWLLSGGDAGSRALLRPVLSAVCAGGGWLRDGGPAHLERAGGGAGGEPRLLLPASAASLREDQLMTLLRWCWSYQRRSSASQRRNECRATASVRPASSAGPISQASEPAGALAL